MALWTPEYIDTALWLDAADSSTVTLVSGAVSEWADKSGNGRDATQGAAGRRPIISTGGLNGIDVVDFDGTDDGLTVNVGTMLSGLSGQTLVAVVKQKTTSSGVKRIIEYAAGSSTTMMFYGLGLTENKLGVGGRRLTANSFQSVSSANNAGINWMLYAGLIDYANADLYLRENGSHAASDLSFQTAGDTGTLTSQSGVVANIPSFISGNDVMIAEIVQVNAYLNDDDLKKIEGYLAHKWSLDANLPVDHPYKSNAPILHYIPITLSESLAATDFSAIVINADTGSLISNTKVTSATTQIDAGVAAPCFVTLYPDYGTSWQAESAYALNDKVFPTNPETTPYYYECTTAGTSGATEPTWPTAAGTVNDGTAVWTFVERMVQPITHGPLVPD
ncbi:MAG: hypothetical protein PHT48_09515 [Dechloromonas sp.]|nr:hypothetical protein [Dechloromonas sp.]